MGGQLSKLAERTATGVGGPVRGLVCMSGGNYGKAMAYLANKAELPATVVMDDTAPASRETIIKVIIRIKFKKKQFILLLKISEGIYIRFLINEHYQ